MRGLEQPISTPCRDYGSGTGQIRRSVALGLRISRLTSIQSPRCGPSQSQQAVSTIAETITHYRDATEATKTKAAPCPLCGESSMALTACFAVSHDPLTLTFII